MRTRDRQAGFTLVEILVAISLLSLLSVGMLVALRIALNSQEHANTRLNANRRVFGAQRALEQELNGFMPVVALWASGDGMGIHRVPFLAGDSRSVRFVSSYSLNGAQRGYPQMLEFAVIPGDAGEGVRLIVNEARYFNGYSAGARIASFEKNESGLPYPVFQPVEPGPQSFVLADKLAYCRMLYLGLEQNPQRREWREEWTKRGWPVALRIEMRPLAADASRLAPLTVTVPLHSDRDTDKTYSDEPGLK